MPRLNSIASNNVDGTTVYYIRVKCFQRICLGTLVSGHKNKTRLLVPDP
jgi:hypothetical protein